MNGRREICLRRGAVRVLPWMLIALVALCVMACSEKKSAQSVQKPPVPVTTGTVTQRAVPVQITVIGTVESSATVAVKAQVGGTLAKVHFTEGQDVRRGQLLFSIDPRPYEAALRQAEANLARSSAQLGNARSEIKRFAELLQKGYISQEQHDQARTNADALDATVKADAAQVENARLQLGYCEIRSPMDGRTGSLLVHEGNLIKANADTAMVTILRIQPVHVSFAVTEKLLPEIRKHLAAGQLPVDVFVDTVRSEPVRGRLTFVENAVDAATGTIRLKGTFANSDRKLWPGQFVNVVLTLRTEKDAVVVASQAVQTGQKGQFVFIVKADGTAEVRPVVVSRIFGEESVIANGLTPGETVVTDGQVRLVQGAKVEVRNAQGAKAGGQEPAGKDQDPGKGTGR